MVAIYGRNLFQLYFPDFGFCDVAFCTGRMESSYFTLVTDIVLSNVQRKLRDFDLGSGNDYVFKYKTGDNT